MATQALLAVLDSMPSEQPQSTASEFAELAEAHRIMLDRVAFRLSGNPDTSKDLVQEALLRAWRRFSQFERGTNAATWLATILTNVFYDQLKHEKVERKSECYLPRPEAFECDPTISGVTDADLHAAVKALGSDLRRVVELCYFQQMRYREAAAVLGVPLSTVGTRLIRARESLRELLTTPTPNVVKP